METVNHRAAVTFGDRLLRARANLFITGRTKAGCVRRLPMVQAVPGRLQTRLGCAGWPAGKLFLSGVSSLLCPCRGPDSGNGGCGAPFPCRQFALIHNAAAAERLALNPEEQPESAASQTKNRVSRFIFEEGNAVFGCLRGTVLFGRSTVLDGGRCQTDGF